MRILLGEDEKESQQDNHQSSSRLPATAWTAVLMAARHMI